MPEKPVVFEDGGDLKHYFNNKLGSVVNCTEAMKRIFKRMGIYDNPVSDREDEIVTFGTIIEWYETAQQGLRVGIDVGAARINELRKD